jgi:peptidyl-tRNA hydrolase
MLLLNHFDLMQKELCGWANDQDKFKNKMFETWLDTSFRKVVLKSDDKEWEKIKLEFENDLILVIDAGLTQIPSGSETVIGLYPMYKSNVPKIIKRLQILK